jgi:GNAT superfamily N-acetyltransferase
MLIRVADVNDVRVLHRVRLSVLENRLTRTAITDEDYIDAITRTGKSWVAEIDGVIRAFAVANKESRSIWALFVEPAFEGRGLGRALHDVMIEWMRSVGCGVAWLETESGARAESFYKKAGWRYVETTADGDARFELDLQVGRRS